MGPLIPLTLAAAVAAATPVRADPVDRWRDLIERASVRFGIPAVWIARVVRAESAGYPTRDGRPIRSRAGAMGLMQLMPGTWAAMRARFNLGANPDDPADNILAGSAFLRMMYDRFGYPGLFAAYNAGPGRYTRVIAGGAPLPAETRAYLGQVTDGLGRGPQNPPAALFAIRYDRVAADAGDRTEPSIFALQDGTP